MRQLLLSAGAVFTGYCLLLAPLIVHGAAEGAYDVKLVWGTNGPKPKDKDLKEVTPELLEKLAPFKWKNYYEVTAKSLPVPKDAPSAKLKLSDKCEIQILDLGDSRVELRLFGEGKPVVKRTQPVVPGEMIIVGGDSKDDTAWFVVLVPPK